MTWIEEQLERSRQEWLTRLREWEANLFDFIEKGEDGE